MGVLAAVIADRNYVIPAFQTAAGIQKYSKVVVLIICAKNDDLTRQLVGNLLNLDCFRRLTVVRIEDTIAPFGHAHFNNAIVYKLLVPLMVDERTDFIMLFDAGIVPGTKFEPYFSKLVEHFSSFSPSSWVMSCYQHPINSPVSDEIISAVSSNGWVTSLSYPSGGVLIFNCRQYRGKDLHYRVINNYNQFHSYLKYADQELIMLSAEKSLVLPLAADSDIQALFLKVDFDNWHPWDDGMVRNSSWWKVCGTVKPWKRWCFDPNRFFYLDELDSIFGLEALDLFSPQLYDFYWAGFEFFLETGARSFNQNYRKFIPPRIPQQR